MLPRILTAAVGLPVLIAVVWAGGYWLTGLIVIIAALASWELCRIAGAWGQAPLTIPAIVLTAGYAASGHFVAWTDHAATLAVLAGSIAIGAAIVMLLALQRVRGAYASMLTTVCIVLFIGGALFIATLIGGASDGRSWILFILAVTFATDTGAYLFGKAFGSRKLAPSISPGKTWEGAIGGLVGAISAGAIFGWAVGPEAPWILLAPILGITGQLGDLYESKLKRMAGFDDSGTIVPGHGGVLDRLDSIIFNLIVLGTAGILFL